MSKFWEQLLLKVSQVEPPPEPKEIIKPGLCECTHQRCSHEAGTGKCACGYPPSARWPDGASCACQLYIYDPDADDDDDDPEGEPTPSPEELEKMFS